MSTWLEDVLRERLYIRQVFAKRYAEGWQPSLASQEDKISKIKSLPMNENRLL